MSTSKNSDDEREGNADISSRRALSPFRLRLALIFLTAICGVVAAVVYFTLAFPSKWGPIPFLLSLIAVCVFLLAIWVAWYLIVMQGKWTWMRLAQQPAKAKRRGDAEAAERALQKALDRARRFSPEDRRRGMMLHELAQYVRNQGRHQEAITLIQEGVEILGKSPKTTAWEWTDYANALFFLSGCHAAIKDFGSAQKVLEKVADLTFAARKKEDITFLPIAFQQIQSLEVVLHLNIAGLLLEMREIAEAKKQVLETETLLSHLTSHYQNLYHDSCRMAVAYMEFLSGNFVASWDELAKIRHPEDRASQSGFAKLHLTRGEFPKAEAILREHLKHEAEIGTIHRPGLLDSSLDLAEALFGQARHDDAFAAFLEARSIVADFTIPADAVWQNTLQTWLQRAKELGRTELATSLEADLQKIPANVNQAITILEKLRIQAPATE